jgi:hypothetical protein
LKLFFKAGIADCDRNDVEEARFLCIAIAANDVEIEQEEESATLSVCKDESSPAFEPEDFTFTVTGNDPFPAQFAGSADCVDVTIGPGQYAVSEAAFFTPSATLIQGNCVQDPNNAQRATGEIQSGETQECRFRNLAD